MAADLYSYILGLNIVLNVENAYTQWKQGWKVFWQLLFLSKTEETTAIHLVILDIINLFTDNKWLHLDLNTYTCHL